MRQIAETVVGIRLDEVERTIRLNLKDYPSYTDAIEAERIIFTALIKKYGMEKVKVDQLVSALSAQGAALAVEMYIAGFLDGGHVAVAFQRRKLPERD